MNHCEASTPIRPSCKHLRRDEESFTFSPLSFYSLNRGGAQRSKRALLILTGQEGQTEEAIKHGAAFMSALSFILILFTVGKPCPIVCGQGADQKQLRCTQMDRGMK